MSSAIEQRESRGGGDLTGSPARGGEGPVGIIAGAGILPERVADAVIDSGRQVYIVALTDFADPVLARFPHDWARISRGSRIIGLLKKNRCEEIVMVGGVRRPRSFVREAGFGLLWFAIRNLDLLAAGDSTVLGRVIRVLEREGFTVRGAHELAPELVLPAGVLGTCLPDRQAEADIARGFRVALGIGALDIGQGAVVSGNRVLAVEAAEGTDQMLARVAALNRVRRGRRGVLVKCPQPIQDLRVDMPTIGPETVRRAAEAKLAGIAIAANRVLVSEAETTRRLADELGLFVIARDLDEPPAEPR